MTPETSLIPTADKPNVLISFMVVLDSWLKLAFVTHEAGQKLDRDETLRVSRDAAEALHASLQLASTYERFHGTSEDYRRMRGELPDWTFDPSFGCGTRVFEIDVLNDPDDPETYTLDIGHSGEADGAFPDVIAASTMLEFYAEKILPLVLGGGKLVGGC